jgi:hypothetical protein
MPAIDIDTDGGAAGQGTMASTSSAEWERNCDSSSNLVAQTHLLANLLGARVPGGRTKEGVMFYFSPSARPKFSKYVGVQEWRNAVFLMFNVVCGNAYGNSFIDKGSTMHVTYYLSERTRVDAPIIKRLADKSPPPPLAETVAKGSTAHLFCRPAPETAKINGLDNHDYVYAGRLKFVSKDLERCPIEFVFELVDYQHLKERPDFQNILSLARS